MDKFRFNTAGRTNLDDYIYRACMNKAQPRIKRLLVNSFAIRGIGLGTPELDRSRQQELFFDEDEKMRKFYLAQDAINNEYGKKGQRKKWSTRENAFFGEKLNLI